VDPSVRVLLADDDAEMCELLARYLGEEGFEVEVVNDGAAAIERARQRDHDILVLDVMMPRIGGFDVLRELRRESELPVLMLTARGDDVDRIVGLELGADDYLPKPFNPRELVARMRAVLRRAQAAADDRETSPPRAVEDVELHPASRTVTRGGVPVSLTGAEFNVLATLLAEPGRLVTKEALTERALGRPLERHDRSIDVHVSRLRRKLGPRPNGAPRIKTVRGMGYLYVDAAAEDG